MPRLQIGSGKENVTISDYSFLQYSGGELVPDKEIEFVAEKLEYKVIHSQKVKNIYKERFIRENAIKHFEPVFSYMEKVFREADGWQVILDDDFVLQVAVQKCWFTDDERIDICQFLTKSDYQYEVRANKDKLSATVRWLVSCDEMLERVQIAITENTFSIKNASSQVISAVNQKKNVVLEQVYARVDDESKIWNKGTDSVYHFFTGIDLQKLNEKVRWFVRLCLEGKSMSMSMSDITLFGYSDSMKIVVKNNMKPKIQYKDEIKQLIDESKKQRYQKALSAASAAFSDYRITAIIQLNEGLLHGNASVSLKNK